MTHVVVQLGHCYRSRGSTGTAGEQDFATRVGQEAARRLVRLGHRCDVRLADDPAIRSDAFVAIHADGSVHASARGASVGHRADAKSVAAADVFKRTYQRMGFPGGFRPDNYTEALAGYYGVREARVAGTPVAFIVEGGFLTNADDRAWMTSDAGIAGCAQAIVAAVLGREANPPTRSQQEDDMARLVRNTTTNHVYQVVDAQTLKYVASGAIAAELDGPDWESRCKRLPGTHDLFTKPGITRTGPTK